MNISELPEMMDKYGRYATLDDIEWVEKCKAKYGIDENQPDWWRLFLDPTTQTIAALSRVEERRN